MSTPFVEFNIFSLKRDTIIYIHNYLYRARGNILYCENFEKVALGKKADYEKSASE